MKRSLSSLLMLFALALPVSADEQFRSLIVTATDLSPITVNEHRTMKIVNFVQDTDTSGGGTPAKVKVTKDNSLTLVTVLQASLVSDGMSAEDKNMRIAGAAKVTVTAPSTGNAFITYKIVSE